MEETTKKRPISITIVGILLLLFGVVTSFKSFNTLNSIITKDQQVKMMEDKLAQAEQTQDFKPSEMQKEFVQLLKDYKVSTMDFTFQFLAIAFHIGLVLAGIFVLTRKKWTIAYINYYFVFSLLGEISDKIFFTYVKPLPYLAILKLQNTQKLLIVVQFSVVLLLTYSLILWYFNRRSLKEYFLR